MPVFSETKINHVRQNFVFREKNVFKITYDLSTESFPKNGLEIFFSITSEHSDDLVDHLFLHFKSLRINDFEIKRKNSVKIIVKFNTLNSLIEYRNFIEYFINIKIEKLIQLNKIN